METDLEERGRMSVDLSQMVQNTLNSRNCTTNT